MTVTVGVDLGSRTLHEADHALRRLAERLPLPAGALALTHRAGPDPHIALSLVLPCEETAEAVCAALTRPGEGEEAVPAVAHGPHRAGPADHRACAAAAAADPGGRAVLFPGAAGLPGTLTVADLLSRTAIDRVAVLGGGSAAATDLLDTHGHLRPERTPDGDLLLRLAPARGGRWVPFEIPDPHPCCGGEGH
jgi:hypothetical protein